MLLVLSGTYLLIQSSTEETGDYCLDPISRFDSVRSSSYRNRTWITWLRGSRDAILSTFRRSYRNLSDIAFSNLLETSEHSVTQCVLCARQDISTTDGRSSSQHEISIHLREVEEIRDLEVTLPIAFEELFAMMWTCLSANYVITCIGLIVSLSCGAWTSQWARHLYKINSVSIWASMLYCST